MNLDSLSFALSQISYSVANLSKKNFKSSVTENAQLVAQHGTETERHLFRCLFSHVDFSGDGKSSGKDFHQIQYLIQECSSLISKPNFVSLLCHSIDNPLHQQKSLKPSSQLFPQISKVLKLSRVQEVIFGLALLDSFNTDTQQHATQFVKQKLPDLLRSYIDSDSQNPEGGLQDVAVEVVHQLLTHLIHSKGQFGIGSEQKEAFLKTLKKDFPKQRVPVVLSPLLYPDKEDQSLEKLSFTAISMSTAIMEGSLADMILDVGCVCTVTMEDCRNTLTAFGGQNITATSVARVLGMMARLPTHASENMPVQSIASQGWSEGKDGQTWNVEIFINSIQEMTPLNWREVIAELDHPGFIVTGKPGLRLLSQGLFRALQGSDFPIELLYRPWKNTEGQLSWITLSLKHPDVFCLANYPSHQVAIDILKSPPDEENREIATWKSLDLIEALLRLSDAGHYGSIVELFKFPIQQCADMLVLSLLQIPQCNNTMKGEILSTLMPIFLGNHPNSGVVLQYAWHCQGQSTTIRTLIMRSMAEWYMRGDHSDQQRLSRILDVAQDLKALSMLLNATPFLFVIDLACLASRREYLKLDKWLTDKIREHGESFVGACLQFLKRRCPQLVAMSMKDEPLPTKSHQLPPETVTTILACLQACAGNVSQERSEVILNMVAHASAVLKARQAPPGAIGQTAGTIGTARPGPLGPPGPLDSMTAMGNLPALGGTPVSVGMGMPSATVGAVGSNFATTLSALNTAPGSPATNAFSGGGSQAPGVSTFKGTSTQAPGTSTFQAVSSQAPGAGINPPGASLGAMHNLTSQLQDLNMQTSLPSGIPRPPPVPGPPGPQQLAALAGNRATQQQNVDRLRQSQAAGDMSAIFPDMNQQFSTEIEDEANSYFQRIYNHPPHPTITIDEVLAMLKRFKDSQDKKEREVFTCMLRNLFEEYKFFPQYPEKELRTTAVLFGGIIEQGLVTYMALGIALRYVLEALRKPHGSRIYFFGVAALDRFKSRLKDYPQYCQHLTGIPDFNEFPPHLIEYIKYGSQSQEPPNKPQGPVSARSLTPGGATGITTVTTAQSSTVTTTTTSAVKGSVPMSKPSIAKATNIDTLVAGIEQHAEEIKVPPEAIQDKVFFIFNNLSQMNMVQKGEELKEFIREEDEPWCAQYLVMKRASIEPNFHTLYANFLESMKNAHMMKLTVQETFRNIKVLLRSDKGVANFSDRSLLKNLGHWLGLLTLAKNKPIMHNDIDLKGLLYEAYHKGQQELLYVVPFVAKVLESCAKSKVFKPPNPWMIGLMNVLAELHQDHSLKLNLKFEIEVLCKTLTIDINELTPVTYLKNTERVPMIEHQLSAPKAKEMLISTPRPAESTTIAASLTTFVVTSAVTTPAVTTATSVATPTPMVPMPPQPQFAYSDINTANIAGIVPHLTINEQIGVLQTHPQLKQLVRPAIERSITELLVPVVERSVKIALTACEQIVNKDFALDPEEVRMRAAAHHMVRNMAAGMALITCREPLLISITNNIKTQFMTALRSCNPAQKELVERAATTIAQDNTEVACAFIQKTAVEKAIPEIDKRLTNEFDLRKHARNESRRYCDPVVLTYQAERMPEQIRLKVGGVTSQQIAVYEEFARNIPGFLPNVESNQHSAYVQKPATSYATDEITQIYDKIYREIQDQYQLIMGHQQAATLQKLADVVLLARSSHEIVTALSLLQKAVEGLLDGLIPSNLTDTEIMLRYRDCHLLVLRGLQDPRAYGPQWTNKQVTRCLIECREEYRYNIEAVDCLIKSHLVNMQQYDLHLAQAMDNGMNYMAVAFGMQLIQRYCLDDKHNTQSNEADFYNTIETLGRISVHSRQAPDGLAGLIEAIKAQNDGGLIDRSGQSGPSSMMQSGMLQTGISQAREFDDPPGLHEKTEYLLREWVNMFHSPQAGRDSTKAFSAFVGQMHQQGILKTDDLITRFFRLCTEMCVDLCYRALGEQAHSPTLIRAKCFHTLDAYVRLIALLVKHSGDSANTVTKINLLNKVLGIVAGVLLQDHEVRNTEFQQLPYHRIFIMLFIELNAPEHILETINFQVLTAFCNTFHILRPSKAPGFAYAWLELVSHRVFMGRMLAITPQQRGWGMYAQLLIDLFKFLSPFLRNADLNKPTQLLYKGTLRVLLVLLHDFPEFLCDYHYSFCDFVQPNCIQMRNLILSAFPRNMRLPDPFTPNLKVDMLQEVTHAPRIMTNFANLIQPKTFKQDLDSYLQTRSPVTFLSELRSNLQVSNDPGLRYNIPLINALVLYVGTQAIQYIHGKSLTSSMSTIAHSAHMDIFQNLAVDLDTEGRYLFLNAIANQLRYPNSHTHYYSCCLLYLFAEANSEAIQEQITRVLLERLIVNRPHPWGLLITFIELIKNPNYRFWGHEFVHCAPEIEKLFESVARSCMQPRGQSQTIREQEAVAEVH